MATTRTVQAAAERAIAASAETVYRCVADMRDHHPNFLPPAFSDFQVESKGVGAGTVVRFTMTAGGRTRPYRMLVAEPEPGRVLTESDTGSSLVTTFTVDPSDGTGPSGGGCTVRITSTWDGAPGIGGFFERLFAPKAMARIFDDELSLLDAYARGLAGPGAPA